MSMKISAVRPLVGSDRWRQARVRKAEWADAGDDHYPELDDETAKETDLVIEMMSTMTIPL